ncbi:hypothetical protein BDV10DRAFT_183823 [Aspergillus recurvatus]
MPCTTYETMCPQCKFHYTKLREKAVLPGHLNYPPGTYPVIFTCDIKLNLSLDSRTTFIDPGTTVLPAIKARLEAHFKLPVSIYTNCTLSSSGSTTHIHQSLLFDFPFKLKDLEQWKSWLAEFVKIGIFEKRYTLRPRAYYSTGPGDWDILCPDEEEEGHLYETVINSRAKSQAAILKAIDRKQVTVTEDILGCTFGIQKPLSLRSVHAASIDPNVVPLVDYRSFRRPLYPEVMAQSLCFTAGSLPQPGAFAVAQFPELG